MGNVSYSRAWTGATEIHLSSAELQPDTSLEEEEEECGTPYDVYPTVERFDIGHLHAY